MALSLLLLAVLAAESAPAADEPRALDRVSVWLGGFQADSNTTVSARAGDGDYTAAGTVNLERDLGLDQREPVTHARLDFLVGESQGLSLEYFGYRRSNETRLSRQIEFDGQVYQADARLRGDFDYDFASAAYRWWFGEGATVYGLGLGLAGYWVQTLLDGEASLDEDSVRATVRSSDQAVAPLLALGWRHAFSDQVRVYADLSGVAKGGQRLSGHIVDAAVGLEWFPFERAGLALEYGATRIRLDRRRDLLDARLDLALSGPSVFLRIR
ncbi:hypothetical protein [Arenimonas sp. MALMAid1274]|uniref:hypothetical protein n=1 Tax=Arenimonas sp. MALMAid1274 TaxID=3411630 RepID=UPI003B9FDA5E